MDGPFGLKEIAVFDMNRQALPPCVYTYLGIKNRLLCINYGDTICDWGVAVAEDPTQAEQAARWLLDFFTVMG